MHVNNGNLGAVDKVQALLAASEKGSVSLGGTVTSEQPSRAHNDHNVYIVGAGFSAEAGLPLIKDFMDRMRDAAVWLEAQGGRAPEVEAISRVLEFRLRAASAAYRVPLNIENVEELFSLVSASARQELAAHMALAIAATLDYSRSTRPPLAEHEYFPVGALNVPGWSKPATWAPPVAHIRQGMESGQYKGEWYGCPPYEFYLGVMCSYFNRGGPDRRDTIITFNYDLIIEEALNHLGVEFSYGVEGQRFLRDEKNEFNRFPLREAAVRLLKPHGSLNWVSPAISENTELNLSRILKEVGDLSRKISVFQDYKSLRSHKDDQRPHLVPPSWSKSLQVPLTKVWEAAVQALKTATRVIILGYSMPRTDQHFRYLLAAGLQDNISLRKVLFVNPALAKEEQKRELEERLFGLFRRELFHQGIIELVPADIREFLAGPRNMGEESYRVRIGRPLNSPGYILGAAPWTFVTPFQGLSVA